MNFRPADGASLMTKLCRNLMEPFGCPAEDRFRDKSGRAFDLLLIASIVTVPGYAIIAAPTGIVSAALTRREIAEERERRRACAECGTGGLRENARFCDTCGAPLEEESEA